MTHPFEVNEEIELPASPEEVWEAIATGPGVDSWFMGHTEIEPREGGRGHMTLMGVTAHSTVTAWEPGRRFAYRTDENPDGTFMAFEYIIEGRGGSGTTLRFVHSGFLGDDWEAEYDALSKGDGMYLRKLAAYLEHFSGRTSTSNLFAPGPRVTDADHAFQAIATALGLTGTPAVGDRVKIGVEGLAPEEGVVVFADTPACLGAVTSEALYTFIRGYQEAIYLERHGFSDEADAKKAEAAWQSWFSRSFA
ncbi:SRPBCC domain-containing protein [Planotetraspora phitsanulokensis]|uniref:SRPBCC domain-containing protein n=1 Tax=Planotetraspora phitsanulokensis TaxID=575192 RepID=A0A8J3UB64_9ACTN|nr:SRPBCC domain-containing protein [Planotetraspora phitsanulokensis]GII41978.1 hypothetical protein Pph01_69810 [Planotetraspora phitsanulokensis]